MAAKRHPHWRKLKGWAFNKRVGAGGIEKTYGFFLTRREAMAVAERFGNAGIPLSVCRAFLTIARKGE